MGLGKHDTGCTSHVRATSKRDTLGIGAGRFHANDLDAKDSFSDIFNKTLGNVNVKIGEKRIEEREEEIVQRLKKKKRNNLESASQTKLFY